MYMGVYIIVLCGKGSEVDGMKVFGWRRKAAKCKRRVVICVGLVSAEERK